MHIRSISLMLFLGMALFARAAPAAETNSSLVDAARQGDRQTVRSLLDSGAKPLGRYRV